MDKQQIKAAYLKPPDTAKRQPEKMGAFYSAEAMKIDAQGFGWINPEAKVLPSRDGFFPPHLAPDPKFGELSKTILLERTPDGFKVDLRYAGGAYTWDLERIPNPDTDKCLPWIPVVEFVY